MNCVQLAGRIIDEPYRFDTNNNLKGCRFKISVDKITKNDDVAYETYEICVFNNLASLDYEIGTYVGVSGRLQSSKYDKDGKTYYNASIVGNNISFLGK